MKTVTAVRVRAMRAAAGARWRSEWVVVSTASGWPPWAKATMGSAKIERVVRIVFIGSGAENLNVVGWIRNWKLNGTRSD